MSYKDFSIRLTASGRLPRLTLAPAIIAGGRISTAMNRQLKDGEQWAGAIHYGKSLATRDVCVAFLA
jgi:hypothetical protein